MTARIDTKHDWQLLLGITDSYRSCGICIASHCHTRYNICYISEIQSVGTDCINLANRQNTAFNLPNIMYTEDRDDIKNSHTLKEHKTFLLQKEIRRFK